MDADLMKALGDVMGLKVERRERELRSDHPRARGRPVRRRHVVVHRHQGTREGRRLRRLLHRRHLVLREDLGQPRRQRSRRPVRQDDRRRDGHDRAGRSRNTEQEVRQRRQEGRDRARLPRAERGQPRGLERPRAGRDGRLAGRRLPGQAVERPVQARRQELRDRPLRDRDPEDQRHDAADPRRAQGADRQRHVHDDPREVGHPVGRDHAPKINGATS